jgi:hypothetical protein
MTGAQAILNDRFYVIITSIQGPTDCVRNLAEFLRGQVAPILVVADKKGPSSYDLAGTELLSFEEQKLLQYKLSPLLPIGHYARKNLGYLIAMERGAKCIYETDDDNAPKDSWKRREAQTEVVVLKGNEWLNVYRWFSDEQIWPRGMPLELIRNPSTVPVADDKVGPKRGRFPIQQGLADMSPDVDAVWRLVLDREFNFKGVPSVELPPGSWCPFNSQTTWWWKEAFPLLYLPSFCSFRMTDIWRSFVAQRCLWELGCGVVFHAPEVYQNRNEHSLYKDFAAEVDGYLKNAAITKELTGLDLDSGASNVVGNLYKCYELLVRMQAIPAEELKLVQAWIDDVKLIWHA